MAPASRRESRSEGRPAARSGRGSHAGSRDGVATLRQDDHATYVNFLADEGEARVRDAYPGATWNRLVAVKRRHDPTNLFRLNQNVPPDGGES